MIPPHSCASSVHRFIVDFEDDIANSHASRRIAGVVGQPGYDRLTFHPSERDLWRKCSKGGGSGPNVIDPTMRVLQSRGQLHYCELIVELRFYRLKPRNKFDKDFRQFLVH